jgi:hypothetical protein
MKNFRFRSTKIAYIISKVELFINSLEIIYNFKLYNHQIHVS